ncbi:MAG: hypothetical protein K9H26_07555 [Prolixibacteraceae bacterium]|nr:hypothetical protein [Prolixibacteraceae bacterium]
MKHVYKFHLVRLLLLSTLFFSGLNVSAQQSISEISKQLEQLASNQKISLEKLAYTTGKHPVNLIKFGKTKENKPAIFVAANLDGTNLMATRGALWLANFLTNSTNSSNEFIWYILPCGNPDAYQRYFENPQWESNTNKTTVNNDNDEQTDEDGLDDLNGDGLITQMLVKHPLGEYIKDTADTRIVRRAKPEKGEKGMYKLFSEGIDNDGDGEYNEDTRGGVNINRNFNYLYEPYVPEHGKWNSSEPETHALMKFFAEHPEIAMVIVLDKHDNLLFPPETDSKNNKSQKIKVPGYYANRLGIDASKVYSPEELKKEIDQNVEDKELGNRVYLNLLNSTPPENIQSDDLKFYKQISNEYTQFLTKNNLPEKYHKLPEWNNGSFEQFAYFEYGLPVFSMNVYPFPERENSKSKKNDDKNNSETEQLLAYSDSLNVTVFVDWETVSHPDFDYVEVGGLMPFAHSIIVPADSLETRFEKQLPFIYKLAEKIPTLTTEHSISKKSEGIVKLEIFITNNGALPCPTFMGQRNRKPAPVVITLDNNLEFLSGKARTPLENIDAGQTKKFTYLINVKESKVLTLYIEAKNVIVHQPTVKIKLQ